MLTPERTTSTSFQWWTPSATQSAGVPFTRYASMPSMFVAAGTTADAMR